MNKMAKYVIIVGFLLVGLFAMISNSFIGGLLFVLIGIVSIPTMSKKYQEKYPFWENKIIRRGTLAVLALTGFVIMGSQVDTTKEISKNTNVTQKSDKPSKNEIRAIELSKIYFDANGKEVKPDENDVTYKIIEVLNNEKNKARESKNNWQVLSIIIDTKFKDAKSVEIITNNIKDTYINFAPDNYVVEVWDSKKAYLKNIERGKHATQSLDRLMEEFRKTRIPYGDKLQKLKDNWDKKNYPFIAEHKLSLLYRNDTQQKTFEYYPMVDGNYKKFGGKNIKK